MDDLEKYRKEEFTFESRNITAEAIMLMVPVAIGVSIPYLTFWKDSLTIESWRIFITKYPSWKTHGTLIAIPIITGGIFLHELIHGLTWAVFAKRKLKAITVGFDWKSFTPYSYCSEPLPKQHYIIGAIMPAIVEGGLPIVVACTTGSFLLFCFGLFFCLAAAGDFLVVQFLSRQKNVDLVLDHPDKIGCYVYRKIQE
jgi:hypothetical protein